MSRRTYVALLLCLAFLLRFGAVVALRDLHRFHGPGPAGADAVEFNAIALNLASGHGYAVTPGHPTAFRAPGWPLLLGLLYRVSLGNYLLAYVALSLLGAFTCLVTYAAARELLSEKEARVAGALGAVYLPHLYFSTVFLSEALFAFCVALALWLMTRAFRTGSTWLLAAAGLAVGYATLTRPMALLILPCCLPALFRGAVNGRRLAGVAALASGMALMVLPWSIRNYGVFHRPVLIATNGGSTFYGANNDTVLRDPQLRGSWISTVSLPGRAAIEATPDEPAHDEMEWALGKQWARTHLAEMPKLTVFKLARFVMPDTSSANRNFRLIANAGYLPFAALIVAGFVALCQGRYGAWSAGWLAALGIAAADVLSSAIFYGSARFRDGIAPALMVYAAAGCQLAFAQLRPSAQTAPDRARMKEVKTV